MRMFNCALYARYADSFEYYTKINAYVETESNKKCPGGIEGCIVNRGDPRCRQGQPKERSSTTESSANRLAFYGLVYLMNAFLLFIR